ncbi:hypothetical protein BVRB_6g151680 [Beta vulgaris subsp. vulgaris]|nr:hypothetical protein BVRB_6g151680 [Beta vulgaris subsp. vulgaris]
MEITQFLRNLHYSHPSSFSLLFKRLFFTSNFPQILSQPTKFTSIISPFSIPNLITRPFTSSEPKPTSPKPNTKVNFTPPNSDPESEPESEPTQNETINLPPPYDPFSKTPMLEEPQDSKNLQEVFHKMRTEGLMNNAVKMFDEMSKDGLTHEALEMFREIKDKGKMPDVVAHTAVIEAYANAGECKEAHKVYLRMLLSGVLPNAYTYSVLIKSLAAGGMLGDVKSYVLEMLGKGMRPNASTCVAVFEAFMRERKEEEGREFFKDMKERGFVGDEKGVTEVLKGKRGPLFRYVMDIFLAK